MKNECLPTVVADGITRSKIFSLLIKTMKYYIVYWEEQIGHFEVEINMKKEKGGQDGRMAKESVENGNREVSRARKLSRDSTSQEKGKQRVVIKRGREGRKRQRLGQKEGQSQGSKVYKRREIITETKKERKKE